MLSKVVSNTGPILYLFEIEFIKGLAVFEKIFIPEEVMEELKKKKIGVEGIKRIKVVNLKPKFKDVSEVFCNEFSIDLGEAQAIALSLQERADYFLTDDLDARNVAMDNGIEVHGTAGIILRAFREELIGKKGAVERVKNLYDSSSLFITKSLVDYIISEIERFGRK